MPVELQIVNRDSQSSSDILATRWYLELNDESSNYSSEISKSSKLIRCLTIGGQLERFDLGWAGFMQSAEFSDGLRSAALRLFIGCSPAAGPQTFSIYQNPKLTYKALFF